MPYYAVTTLDIDGLPAKREILYRESRFKAWKFIEGRLHTGNFDPQIGGVIISEATDDESWDWDIEEPLARTTHAVEVPLLPEQIEIQADDYIKKLKEKKFR